MKFDCEKCGVAVRAPERAAGKRVRCPSCGEPTGFRCTYGPPDSPRMRELESMIRTFRRVAPLTN